MTFKTLHTNIKAIIIAGGFKYIPADKWFNIELGQFPQALVNNSFTLKFTGLSGGAKIHTMSILDIQPEFVLNAKNDIYLDVFDKAMTAVKNLKDVTIPNYGKIIVPPLAQFSTVYFSDYVILTFNDVKIEVK